MKHEIREYEDGSGSPFHKRDGDIIIILLGGGSKRGQSADIQAAKERWAAYRKAR